MDPFKDIPVEAVNVLCLVANSELRDTVFVYESKVFVKTVLLTYDVKEVAICVFICVVAL